MIHPIHLNQESPKIWIIPDVHGREKAFGWLYQQAFINKVDLIFQVGDFGYNWPKSPKEPYANTLDHILRYSDYNIPVYLIPGNHDNWDKINLHLSKYDFKYPVQVNKNLWIVPRGGICRAGGLNFFCFSGAISSDYTYRTGIKKDFYKDRRSGPWWADESPTDKEIDFAISQLKKEKCDIFLSHDAPANIIGDKYGREINTLSNLPVNHVQHILSRIERYSLDHKLWIYGHHHDINIQKINDIYYICAGRFDWYDTPSSLIELATSDIDYKHFEKRYISKIKNYSTNLLVQKKRKK